MDDARRGIAIEHRHGATKHIHALDIVELEELTCGRLHVDRVLINGDGTRRIGIEVIEPHAANEERGIGGCKSRLDLEVGREVREIPNVLDAILLELIGIKADLRDTRLDHLTALLASRAVR